MQFLAIGESTGTSVLQGAEGKSFGGIASIFGHWEFRVFRRLLRISGMECLSRAWYQEMWSICSDSWSVCNVVRVGGPENIETGLR